MSERKPGEEKAAAEAVSLPSADDSILLTHKVSAVYYEHTSPLFQAVTKPTNAVMSTIRTQATFWTLWSHFAPNSVFLLGFQK